MAACGISKYYWNTNIPQEQWTEECPDYLQGLNDKMRRILSTPDRLYHRLTWDEVKEVVRLNKLDEFQRLPSDLRRYLHYTTDLKQQHGSIMNFIIQGRVKWQDLTPVALPFVSDDDIKILHNDWPYGIDRDIVHLVVWTKFDLEEDSSTGDLSDEARRQIDAYVDRIFRSKMPANSVTWFKNWRSLKSVEAVEHFHVMLYRPDKGLIDGLTGHDEPLQETVKKG